MKWVKSAILSNSASRNVQMGHHGLYVLFLRACVHLSSNPGCVPGQESGGGGGSHGSPGPAPPSTFVTFFSFAFSAETDTQRLLQFQRNLPKV